MWRSRGDYGARVNRSEPCRDVAQWEVRLHVVPGRLPLREFDRWKSEGLVRDPTEQVGDDIESAALLILIVRDEPWRPCGVGGCKHGIAGPRVVIPAAVGLQVQIRQLPDLAWVVDPTLQPSGLFFGADLQPVLDQDDAGVDDRLLGWRYQLEKPLGLFGGTKSHD